MGMLPYRLIRFLALGDIMDDCNEILLPILRPGAK